MYTFNVLDGEIKGAMVGYQSNITFFLEPFLK